MNQLDRFAGRLIYDPCLVRLGWAPRRGIAARWFTRVGGGRIIRLPRNHPLAFLRDARFHSNFSLATAEVLWMWHHVRRSRARAILEMGSGISTGMFSLYARQLAGAGRAPPRIISIDHDRGWLEKTGEMLDSLGTRQYVQLLECTANSTASPHGPGYVIDLERFRTILKSDALDFVFIDGPPSRIGRSGTLPTILPLLADRAQVFFDDAGRPAEQQALSQWSSLVGKGFKLRGVLPLGSGLAWIEIRR